MVCEGNEDIDSVLRAGTIETQVKDLRARLTINSADIVKTIGGFLVSFAELRDRGQRCHFVFLTTGTRGNLQRWAKGKPKTARRRAQEAMQEWLSGATIGERWFDSGLGTIRAKLEPDARKALTKIRRDGCLMDFQNSVHFYLEKATGGGVIATLEDRISDDSLFEGLFTDDVLRRLQDAVASASAEDDADQRMLRRFDLECLAANAAIAHCERNWVGKPAGARAFLGYAENESGGHCHALVLVASIAEAEKRLHRVREGRRRMGGDLPSLSKLLSHDPGLEWFREVNFQLFACLDPLGRFRRRRSRVFVAHRHLRHQALEPNEPAVTSDSAVAAALKSFGVRKVPTDNLECQLADLLAAEILSVFPTGVTSSRVRSRLLMHCAAKTRCVYDRSQRAYYTREAPLPLDADHHLDDGGDASV